MTQQAAVRLGRSVPRNWAGTRQAEPLSANILFHIGMTCLYGIYILLCNIQCRDGVMWASGGFNSYLSVFRQCRWWPWWVFMWEQALFAFSAHPSSCRSICWCYRETIASWETRRQLLITFFNLFSLQWLANWATTESKPWEYSWLKSFVSHCGIWLALIEWINYFPIKPSSARASRPVCPPALAYLVLVL